MLGMAGFVAFRIPLKRLRAAAAAAIVCYAPVVINGLFPGDTPLLHIAVGLVIVTLFVIVIARVGLLATIATLTAHFILLRAPLTTDLSSWRGPTALFIGAIVALGLFGCYVASGSAQRATPRAI